jgi:alpha-tubulin suppressor-like RCC1 family protein
MHRVALIATLAACGRVGFDSQRTGTDATIDDAPVDSGPPGWTYIHAGDQVTCGIYLDRPYCWGRGTLDELGNGVRANRGRPTAVALPAGRITAFGLGEAHGCAIVDDEAYCWGNAPPGTGALSSPLPVRASLPSPVTSIGGGNGFTCAVAAGTAYCWGADTQGALGNGASTATLPTPNAVSLPAPVVSLDAGNDHAVALLADQSVWAWGHNDNGALGLGTFDPAVVESPMATVITGAQPSLGGWHACVANDGAARCWGTGTAGELGNGALSSNALPQPVSGMSTGVDAIEANGGPTEGDATCALVAGEVWCWGNGHHGRLGTGATASASVPMRVQGLPADTVQLAVGYSHTCVRSAAGIVRCWGRGDLGQLGDGAMTGSFVPVVVPPPDL